MAFLLIGIVFVPVGIICLRASDSVNSPLNPA